MAGIILGALGGAGGALQDIGATLMKDDLAAQARTQESNLALERAKTLEAFKQELQTAPLNRLTSRAKELAKQEVPMEAAPVTRLSGNIPLADGEMGPKGLGFQGDIGVIKKAIGKLPDGPDKAAAEARLDRQIAGEGEFESGIVAGRMRKRSSEEALNAAVEDAKVNDIGAYAEYEAKIGKPKRDERRVASAEQREENRAEQDARKWELDLQKLDLQQASLDMQNRKVDALIEKRDNDANKDTSRPERLYSIVNAMNQTIRNLNDGSKGSTPESKAEWQRQMDTAVRVRDRASQLLDANMDERGAAPAGATPPAKPPATLPMPREKSALQTGAVYQTSRGPAKWNGTAFEAQ